MEISCDGNGETITNKEDFKIFLSFHGVCQPKGGGGGGTRQNFDRGAHVIFLGLKLDQLLWFWVAQNEGYFFLGGGLKNKHYFWGLTRNLHHLGGLLKR